MKIYDEVTREELASPNLETGYTYPVRRQTGTRIFVLDGTTALYPPNGLQHEVPVYEDCLYYHTYTEDELAAMHPPDEPQPSDTAATWDELAAAYGEGVSMA